MKISLLLALTLWMTTQAKLVVVDLENNDDVRELSQLLSGERKNSRFEFMVFEADTASVHWSLKRRDTDWPSHGLATPDLES